MNVSATFESFAIKNSEKVHGATFLYYYNFQPIRRYDNLTTYGNFNEIIFKYISCGDKNSSMINGAFEYFQFIQ